MKIVILFFVFASCFAQKEFTILRIDSTDVVYKIEIQKLHSSKTTIIYSSKDKSDSSSEKRVTVGKVYKFHFIKKYRIGTPELRYDENGNEIFLTKESKFIKNNTDKSYSVSELKGLYYTKDD